MPPKATVVAKSASTKSAPAKPAPPADDPESSLESSASEPEPQPKVVKSRVAKKETKSKDSEPKTAKSRAGKKESKDSESKERKPRKPSGPRVKMTFELYDELCNNLVEKLTATIEEKVQVGSRYLGSIRAAVKDLQKKAARLSKKKRVRDPNTVTVNGFDRTVNVTPDMRKFLGVSEDEELTRKDLTVAVCTYIKVKEGEARESSLRWATLNPGGKRDLQDPDNKKFIKPDATLRKLFNLDERDKKIKAGTLTTKAGTLITDNRIAYTTLQSLLAAHVVKNE